MRTTDVGVETSSLTLNSKLRTEKEQMSTPDPAIALKMPPIKPTTGRTEACHTPKLGIESKVFRLCWRLRRKRLKAKLNQTQTKPSFFSGGVRRSSMTSRPRIMPNIEPKLQKMMLCHSSLIFIHIMVKAAAVIPRD